MTAVEEAPAGSAVDAAAAGSEVPDGADGGAKAQGSRRASRRGRARDKSETGGKQEHHGRPAASSTAEGPGEQDGDVRVVRSDGCCCAEIAEREPDSVLQGSNPGAAVEYHAAEARPGPEKPARVGSTGDLPRRPPASRHDSVASSSTSRWSSLRDLWRRGDSERPLPQDQHSAGHSLPGVQPPARDGERPARGSQGSGGLSGSVRRWHGHAVLSRIASVAWLVQWWARRRTPTDAEKAAPSIRRDSIWRQPLPTIAALVTHTRSGAWAPGEWPRPVEAVGKAYGYTVAIPGSLLLYGTAWTIQRPSRLLGVVVFVVLLAVSL